MATDNLYEDLKDVLQEFKDFLDENVSTIKPAVQALKSVIPQITDLLDKLIELMGKLRTEIERLDVSGIPGIGQVSSFTSNVTEFLNTTKALLPDEADTIDDILGVASVVTGLPSLDEVKDEIIKLIDAILHHLEDLNAT
jgi:ABC-type transporter Mla subunit MlaD